MHSVNSWATTNGMKLLTSSIDVKSNAHLISKTIIQYIFVKLSNGGGNFEISRNIAMFL